MPGWLCAKAFWRMNMPQSPVHYSLDGLVIIPVCRQNGRLWLLSCTSLATCPSSSSWFMPTMILGNWCLFVIHFFLSWYNFFLDFIMRSNHLHFFLLNLNPKVLYKRLQNSSLTISKGNSSMQILIMLTPNLLPGFLLYCHWFMKISQITGGFQRRDSLMVHWLLILERLVWSASDNISANTSV